MLEYIAICNAAYSTIKKAIENGRELSSVAKSISQFTHAADDLRRQKDKKKNSIFSKFTGKDETDLDEFFALEEIKEKEEELKRMMIYLGRPGLHSDWVRFQVEARKRRQQEEKEREAAKEEFMNTLTILGAVVGGCAIFVIVLLVVFKGMKIL